MHKLNVSWIEAGHSTAMPCLCCSSQPPILYITMVVNVVTGGVTSD